MDGLEKERLRFALGHFRVLRPDRFLLSIPPGDCTILMSFLNNLRMYFSSLNDIFKLFKCRNIVNLSLCIYSHRLNESVNETVHKTVKRDA